MNKSLWIIYAWADNDEGDFDYLVQELDGASIPAIYDKIRSSLVIKETDKLRWAALCITR